MSTMQMSLREPETHYCEPTLTDDDVVEFCKNGFVKLDAVVPDEINQRVTEYLEHNSLDELREEDWFIQGVLLNPEAAGALRSLLGAHFALPVGIANHRVECPSESQGWHRDGGSRQTYEMNHLQVFYYPQETPLELGPTEIVPGSHFLHSLGRYMAHYGGIRSGARLASPAGTIFLTAYHIWHRRGAATGHGLRNMLKYCYWRTVAPKRDWVTDDQFDGARAQYTLGANPVEQFRDWYDASEMFFWLCGQLDEYYELLGGKGWPMGYPPPYPGCPIYPPRGFHRFA